MLHYNYWEKLFMKNSLIFDKFMWICTGQELHALPFPLFPFSSLVYLPTFHQSLPSPLLRFPSLTTLPSPSTSLPCPFRSSLYSSVPLNLPLSLSTFLFPFQHSSFPLNLPLSLSTFLFPSQPSSLPLNLPPSISTFPFPSKPYPSLLFLFPTYIFPFLSPSLLISFPTYPLLYLSTSLSSPSTLTFPLPHPSLSSVVTLFLSFSPSLYSPIFTPFIFPFFLHLLYFPSPSLFSSLPLLWVFYTPLQFIHFFNCGNALKFV